MQCPFLPHSLPFRCGHLRGLGRLSGWSPRSHQNSGILRALELGRTILLPLDLTELASHLASFCDLKPVSRHVHDYVSLLLCVLKCAQVLVHNEWCGKNIAALGWPTPDGVLTAFAITLTFDQVLYLFPSLNCKSGLMPTFQGSVKNHRK